MHATYNSENHETANNVGESFSNFFSGGGLKASFGNVSIGFIGGVYGGGMRGMTGSNPAVFRWTVPVSLGLSNQIFFIDKLIGDFNFDNFNINKLFAQLSFIPLHILTAKLGINVYYKDEGFSAFVKQRLIGASLTSKYLQFDGGYRFFENYTYNLVYDDGPYGRLILKIPFDGKLALALSASYSGIDKTANSKMSFGIGISLFGNIWQTFLELGAETTFIEHLNYASLGD